MRHFGLICALFVAGSTAGCFSVDFTGLSFQCDPAQTGGAACPDGYTCSSSSKLCVATGGGTTTDLGTGLGTDMASGTTPITLVSTSACPSGKGYDVSNPGSHKVYACPTTFDNMAGTTADALCKSGYTLCANTTNLDLMACSLVGASTMGFFVSGAEARRDNGGEVLCGAPSPQHPNPMWSGCGRMLSTNFSRMSPPDCQGFTEALDCPATGLFHCAGAMMDVRIGDAINSDPAGGILCCGP